MNTGVRFGLRNNFIKKLGNKCGKDKLLNYHRQNQEEKIQSMQIKNIPFSRFGVGFQNYFSMIQCLLCSFAIMTAISFIQIWLFRKHSVVADADDDAHFNLNLFLKSISLGSLPHFKPRCWQIPVELDTFQIMCHQEGLIIKEIFDFGFQERDENICFMEQQEKIEHASRSNAGSCKTAFKDDSRVHLEQLCLGK